MQPEAGASRAEAALWCWLPGVLVEVLACLARWGVRTAGGGAGAGGRRVYGVPPDVAGLW
jgi:hypothetical protein